VENQSIEITFILVSLRGFLFMRPRINTSIPCFQRRWQSAHFEWNDIYYSIKAFNKIRKEGSGSIPYVSQKWNEIGVVKFQQISDGRPLF